MEAAVFFMLCFRLPAYRGVMQAVARQEAEGTGGAGGARRPARGRAGGYERNSPQANNARTADFAPPATGGSIAALDTTLGGGWISHRVVKPDGTVT
jgi:hypothetical protein